MTSLYSLDYLGRLIVSNGILHTVVKVEQAEKGYPRLYIATDRRNHGWEGHWVSLSMVAQCGRTVLHWHWNSQHRETPQRCEALYQTAVENVARMQEEARKKEQARRALEKERKDRLTQLIPADAKAVIVARLHEDRSDPMTDYYGSRIVREVLLGFSKSTRESFKEMRRAAALFPETAALAGPEGEERREKYSMGRGYYLKRKGVSWYAGWEVRKLNLDYGVPALELEHWQSLA